MIFDQESEIILKVSLAVIMKSRIQAFCSLSFHLRLPGWEFEIVKLYFKWVFSNGMCSSILGYF
uniref:Putative ovule protein n=1 Tax=Solanum chacoense TaxID=4108 RepID=A0A0V0H8E7_SOLCH